MFYAKDLMFLHYLMLSTWWQVFLIQVLYFAHCDLWFQRPIPGWWDFSQTLSLKDLKYTTVIRQFCRILVTPVSFTLWPCVMYCFHYFPVWLWCLLCIGTDSVSGFPPGVHTEHGTELRVFLLVCGLRRVKDPLYLVEDFSGISKNLSLNVTCRCCISIHAKTPDSRRNVELQRRTSTAVTVILQLNCWLSRREILMLI